MDRTKKNAQERTTDRVQEGSLAIGRLALRGAVADVEAELGTTPRWISVDLVRLLSEKIVECEGRMGERVISGEVQECMRDTTYDTVGIVEVLVAERRERNGRGGSAQDETQRKSLARHDPEITN